MSFLLGQKLNNVDRKVLLLFIDISVLFGKENTQKAKYIEDK